MAQQPLITLTFEVAGEKQLDAALGAYEHRAQDYRGAWPAIREDFVEGQKRQFATEGKFGSGGWEELSPVYAAWKSVHFPGRPILQRTRRLHKSLTSPSHADHVYDPGRKGLTLGTRVPYAGYHQTGTRRMPQRKPIELTSAQRTRWMKILHEHVIKTKQAISIMPGDL